MAETKIYEDATKIIWENLPPGWPNSGARTLRTEWKPGSEGAVVEQEYANKSAIETNLEQDQIAMQAIIDLAANSIVVTTLPQAQQAARDALQRDKDIARNLKRLNRTALKDYDGTT